jgi:hypothetical protein
MVAPDPLAFTIDSVCRAIENNHDGVIVECGAWKGGSSFAMLLAQRYYFGRIIKPVWMFDSFEGLPPADERDGPLALNWQRDVDSPNYVDNCKAPVEQVKTAISRFGFAEGECTVVEGWFADTIPSHLSNFRENSIALLRVDCDWYEPVRYVLDALVPFVTPECRVILDDYYAWDGCARATHDFLSSGDHSYRIRSVTGFGSAWFEKRAARLGPL